MVLLLQAERKALCRPLPGWAPSGAGCERCWERRAELCCAGWRRALRSSPRGAGRRAGRCRGAGGGVRLHGRISRRLCFQGHLRSGLTCSMCCSAALQRLLGGCWRALEGMWAGDQQCFHGSVLPALLPALLHLLLILVKPHRASRRSRVSLGCDEQED